MWKSLIYSILDIKYWIIFLENIINTQSHYSIMTSIFENCVVDLDLLQHIGKYVVINRAKNNYNKLIKEFNSVFIIKLKKRITIIYYK